MAHKNQVIFKLLTERIKFYGELSEMPNVYMQQFEVFEHPSMPNAFFLHLKYQLNNNGKFTDHQEIETFTDDKGWVCMVNQTDLPNLLLFLQKKRPCQIDTKNVKLK